MRWDGGLTGGEDAKSVNEMSIVLWPDLRVPPIEQGGKPVNNEHQNPDSAAGSKARISLGGKAAAKAITVQVCVRVRPRIAKIDDAEEQLALAKSKEKDGKGDGRPGKLQVTA